MDYNTLSEALQNFDDSSRVWVYQSNRALTTIESDQIQEMLDQFTTQWVAHNRALKSTGFIIQGRFIILMVDESRAGASGCSIDASVNFLRQLQSHFHLDLFDRMTFAYMVDGEVTFADKDQFSAQYTAGQIDDQTKVIDTLVKDKRALLNEWIKPLGESWHRRLV